MDRDDLTIIDVLSLENTRVRRLLIGDEMPVRYVPQSRYFQPQELDVAGWNAPPDAVACSPEPETHRSPPRSHANSRRDRDRIRMKLTRKTVMRRSKRSAS